LAKNNKSSTPRAVNMEDALLFTSHSIEA